jgi:hypothetical protein
LGAFSGILAFKQYFVGTELDETVYHVLLQGRTIGPYDRRTIVGMRIKKTLASDDVLISAGGAQLTVADLIGQRPVQQLNPERSASLSIVRATYSASLLAVDGSGLIIPKFKDEIQARVQADVLRLAGRFRQVLGWKEGRVKIGLKDVVHARVKGSQVELWLRNAQQTRLQRVALELFTPETAVEFVDWLPAATPVPDEAAAASRSPAPNAGPSRALWSAVAGLILLAALIGIVLLRP